MKRVIQLEKNDALFLVIDCERLVDDVTLQDVQHEILEVLAQKRPRLVIDLNRVGFVASAALGMLVRFRKRRGEHGFSLKLCSINGSVDEAFRITGLNTLFQIYKDHDEAIASFDNP